MPIKAISFDFWNTLYTEQPGGFLVYKNRRRGLLTEALSNHRAIPYDQVELACHLEAEQHNLIWQREHRTLLATERVGAILRHLNITLSDVDLAGLARGFEEGILEHPPVLVDGARHVIDHLSEHYRLAIISDVGFSPGRVLKQVLATSGLLHRFDSLIFSDEAGRAKPHSQVFEATARVLSLEPSEIVHVGDLERTDIAGAKQAGYRAIRFIGITPMEDGEETIADFVTDDLADIPRLVGML